MACLLQDNRTTGAAEAFNGKCGQKFKTHGNIFDFLSVYQREEVVKTETLERDVNGLIQNDSRKKKFKDRSLVIEHYSTLLRDGKISISRFLNTMSNMDNKIAFEENEYPDLTPDEIGFQTDVDLEQFMEMGQNISSDTDPIVLQSLDAISVPVVVHKHQRSKKTTANVENQPVLTRSKVRKLQKQQIPSNVPQDVPQEGEHGASEGDFQLDDHLKQSLEMCSNTISISTDSIVLQSLDAVSVPSVVRKHQRTKKITTNVENQPVLTRSKARKLHMQKEQTSSNVSQNCKRGATEAELDDVIDVQPTQAKRIIDHHAYETELGTTIVMTRSKSKNVSNPNPIEIVSPQIRNTAQTLTVVIDSEVSLLNEKFIEIINGKTNVTDSNLCIMDCKRPKATVLLPCKHQPICNQCFVLWKLFLSEQKRITFCPVCEIDITSHIVINV